MQWISLAKPCTTGHSFQIPNGLDSAVLESGFSHYNPDPIQVGRDCEL